VKLERSGNVQTFQAGVELFKQDEPANAVYFLRDGAIKLVWTNADGAEAIVGLRWPGSFLGAAARIALAVNPAAAVTLIQSAIEIIPGNVFAELLVANDEFTRQLQSSESLEILEHVRVVAEFACMPARTRVQALLSRLIHSLEEKIRLSDGRLLLPVKRKELATLVGITPEHLSRLLHELAADHVIDLHDKWIVVRNSDKLAA
jgi:CRP/FNR family transcriptional regulator